MKPISRESTIIESLIESELSASESYRLALEALPPERPGAGELRRIGGEHRLAAQRLRERCRCAAPVSGAGWGLWSGASIETLRAGEEAEIREYEAALEDPDLGEECRKLIASLLLPQTQAHLPMLERFSRR